MTDRESTGSVTRHADDVLHVRIVGPGRAGGSFAAALTSSGVHIETMSHGSDVIDAATGADLVLLCTPDDQIAQVAEAIRPGDAVVGHCSGSRTLDVLAPHARRCSIHPLMSLPDSVTGAQRLLAACRFAVAGDEIAIRVVDAMGGIPFAVSDSDRARYHATASIASNHLVALCAEVESLAAELDIDPSGFWQLMRTTLENVAEHDAASQLTGPVARGDWATVITHLDALGEQHHEPYIALATIAARLAGHELPTDIRR